MTIHSRMSACSTTASPCVAADVRTKPFGNISWCAHRCDIRINTSSTENGLAAAHSPLLRLPHARRGTCSKSRLRVFTFLAMISIAPLMLQLNLVTTWSRYPSSVTAQLRLTTAGDTLSPLGNRSACRNQRPSAQAKLVSQ